MGMTSRPTTIVYSGTQGKEIKKNKTYWESPQGVSITAVFLGRQQPQQPAAEAAPLNLKSHLKHA